MGQRSPVRRANGQLWRCARRLLREAHGAANGAAGGGDECK